MTGGVNRVLRFEKSTHWNDPRSKLSIHVADEHKVFFRQVTKNRREVAVSPAEQRHTQEIDNDAAARIIAFRHLGPERIKRQAAKHFDRLARFALEQSGLFVERQSDWQKSKYLPGVRVA